MGTQGVGVTEAGAAAEPRWPIVAITTAFVLHGVIGFWLRLYVDDEGLLTYFFGSWAWTEPMATLFLQKSRPTLALLYSAPSAAGLGAFTLVHVLVAAAALPLTASLARRAGARFPWSAAAIVALSPLMLAGSVAGVSNTDAVTAGALASWLLFHRRAPLAAGLVLGLALFARSEMALLAVVLIAVGGPSAGDRWKLLAAAAGVVVSFVALGSLYHGDVAWFRHYPPALTSVNPAVSEEAVRAYAGDFRDLVISLLTLSPAFILLFAARWSRATRIERASLAFVILFIVSLRIMPIAGVFNFDASPRYLLPVLPFVGIVGANVLGRISRGLPARQVMTATLATMALAAGLTLDATRMTTGQATREVASVVGRSPEREVITNIHTLATYLELGSSARRPHIRYLLQADQRYELEQLTNDRVGQREAILQAMDRRFYGDPLVVETLDPSHVEPGTLFALSRDERLEAVMPPATWEQWLDVRAEGRSWTVARLRESPKTSGDDGP